MNPVQFSIILGQQGNALNDTINRPADCNSGGYGTGTVEGSTVSFTVTCVSYCLAETVDFQYTGTVTGDTISGTYTGGTGDKCPGWTGTWKVARD